MADLDSILAAIRRVGGTMGGFAQGYAKVKGKELLGNAQQNAGPMAQGLKTGLLGQIPDMTGAALGATKDAWDAGSAGAWPAAYQQRIGQAQVQDAALQAQSPDAYDYGQKLPQRVSDALGVVGALGHMPKPADIMGPPQSQLAFARIGEALSPRAPIEAPVSRAPVSKAGELIDYNQAAYHGSPHDYEAPDLSKVGTGEGTADEGWGYYASSDPEIGEWYRANLSEVRETGSPGSIRRLDVPENDVLLDWHAPLSEQPPAVQAALRRGGWLEGDRVKAWGITDIDGEPLGQDPAAIKGKDFYSWLAGEHGSKQAASMKLNEAGIPGVKYADPRRNYSLPASDVTPDSFVIWDQPSIKQEARAPDLSALMRALRGGGD